MKTFREILNEYKQKSFLQPVSDRKLITGLEFDYDNLVDLRERIINDMDENNYDTSITLYEEDCIVLDHILDFYEILIEKAKNETKQPQCYKVGVEFLNENGKPIDHIKYEETDNFNEAIETYNNFNIEENKTAKYIILCTPENEITLDSMGYKE